MLAKFIKTIRPSKKLSEKFLGPFEVSDRLGPLSYWIRLPDHLKAIHPIFHVSQLEPAPPNQILNCIGPLPPPIKLDGNLEFKVMQILNSKLDKRRKDPLFYYVQWSGYENMADKNSWLTVADLKNATEIVVSDRP